MVLGGAAEPTEEAPPAPILGPSRQIGSAGISLHIASQGVEVLVFLDGKRFESALIKVPRCRPNGDARASAACGSA